MNKELFWRILIVVVVVVAIGGLLTPLARVLGFPISGDVLQITRICIAAIAILYVLKG